MGSFDGWTQGEEMSPEYTGDYARFSATLKLRPGRYTIFGVPFSVSQCVWHANNLYFGFKV